MNDIYVHNYTKSDLLDEWNGPFLDSDRAVDFIRDQRKRYPYLGLRVVSAFAMTAEEKRLAHQPLSAR